METVTNFRNINERLTAACDSLDWDHQNQAWNTYDGHWYSLAPAKLISLENNLELFVDSCNIGIDIQWVIANDMLVILKNILSNPDFKHNTINQHVWQLIFNLVIGNTMNQTKIWKECSELLLNYLQLDFRQKDTCRLIVFNIYCVGRLAQNEGTQILKILLKSFNQEMDLDNLKRQGLNMFLEHFIIDENYISVMYLKLTIIEKLWLLQFTRSYVEQGHFKVLPISIDLMLRICDEFNEKSERISNSGITDINYQEILVLFEVIAAASSESYYELNKLNTELLENIGKLLRNVLDNGELFQKAFVDVSQTDKSLKLLLLATISNLVKSSTTNKEKARENGIIDCILDFFAAEGTNQPVYRTCIFTLIDICQSNPLNKNFLIDLATTKKNPYLDTLLIDINYKRK